MSEKNKITEIGFTGTVQPAACPCHSDHFATVVWLIHPDHGEAVYCSDAIWKTEAEANAELEGFVKYTAAKVLKSMGLSMENAAKITVAHNENAVKAERNLRASLNPNLH